MTIPPSGECRGGASASQVGTGDASVRLGIVSPWAARRVLVTGGSGFIGCHVVDELRRWGVTVMSVDIVRPPAGRLLKPNRFELCDIRSSRLHGVLADFAPDVVVHLAAQTGIAGAASRVACDADVNVRGTINVAEAAVAVRVDLFVFAATCAIYGAVRELPVGEDRELAPITPYGLGKAAALGYIEWLAENRGLAVTSLILGNVYGRDHRGDRAGVISRFVADAIAGRPSDIRGNGTATGDFVHVQDVAEAVLHACAAPAAGRVNIGSGVETSVLDVRAMVSEATGRVLSVRPVSLLAGEIERMCLAVGRAAGALGWRARITLADGISSLVPAGALAASPDCR
jgi:UDP-glucose 4-epimerase